MADRRELIAQLRVASGLAEAPEIAPTQWAEPLQEAADLLERDAAVCEERDQLKSALRVIRGPEDRGRWIDIYREAGGGYTGLQAIAEAALQQADSGEGGEDCG